MTAYSCTEISPDSDAKGYLNINVEKKTPDITYVGSKSAEIENRTISLKIHNNVGDIVKEIDDYTTMGTLELRTGYYRAVASSGESSTGASFDSPFYRGEQEFTIRRGQTVDLDIVCRLANIKITVELDQKIEERFSQYKFTVTGNDDSRLEYNQDLDNFSSEGYFPETATELKWELFLVSKTNVTYKSIKGTYSDVKPCQHYKFKFTLVEENPSTDIGGSTFTIRLDDSLNQKDYDLNLDFGKKNPVINAGEIDLSNISHYTGDPCSINISSESKIQSLGISHEDTVLETAGLPRSVELVGAGQELLSTLAGIGIATDGIVSLEKAESAPESAAIDFSAFLSSLPTGRYSLKLNITNESGATEAEMNVNVLGKRPSAVINAVSADEVWAMFAKVSATYEPYDNPEGFGFRYRTADQTEWTDADASYVITDSRSNTVSAEIRGLQPSTEYVIKAVCSDVEGPETSFTTESAETVPNLGFDDWYQDGEIWYPGLDANNRFWDTANGGSATAKIYPTVPEENTVVSGKAAKLESKSVKILTLNILAAGNIYTGSFVKANISMTKPGAQLKWGVPFKSRPIALKGHYQYTPAIINMTKAPYTDMEGKADIGQIQIMLTDWAEPFLINTSESKFVNINDSHILAYGTVDLSKTSGYEEFTINVDYRDKTKTPTHIVIVASASKYGDYFTGGVGSTLYLDEFELVYNPDELN